MLKKFSGAFTTRRRGEVLQEANNRVARIKGALRPENIPKADFQTGFHPNLPLCVLCASVFKFASC
jgi:hypothetical protein